MSILVTGAAGFIGCNNVIALNRRGITDVIAVDNLEKGDKFKNLNLSNNCKYDVFYNYVKILNLMTLLLELFLLFML